MPCACAPFRAGEANGATPMRPAAVRRQREMGSDMSDDFTPALCLS